MRGDPKPRYGEPCNGCGGCCRSARCPLGALVFGEGDECPALELEGCGLVLHPHRYVGGGSRRRLAEGAALIIGAGLGCDALIEGERPDPVFAIRVRAHARAIRVRAADALAAWRRVVALRA